MKLDSEEGRIVKVDLIQKGERRVAHVVVQVYYSPAEYSAKAMGLN